MYLALPRPMTCSRPLMTSPTTTHHRGMAATAGRTRASLTGAQPGRSTQLLLGNTVKGILLMSPAQRMSVENAPWSQAEAEAEGVSNH